ncbi:unnamed protein product, partial [marine sediment metagenome]
LNFTAVIGDRPIGGAGTVNGYMGAVLGSGQPYVQVGNSDGHFQTLTYSQTVDDNAWHRVLWIFDRSANVSVVVDNGAPQGALMTAVEKSVNNLELTSLRRAGTSFAYAYGDQITIDEVIFFDHVLTPSERTADYALGLGKFYTLCDDFVDGYHMREGSGSAIASIKGLAPGTLVAMEPGDWVTGKTFPFSGMCLDWTDPIGMHANSRIRVWIYGEGTGIHKQQVATIPLGVESYALTQARGINGTWLPLSSLPGHYWVQLDAVGPSGVRSAPSNTI